MSDQSGHQAIDFKSIAVDQGVLYGVVEREGGSQMYPLFVFSLLRQAYLHGEYVNYAPYWPKFMQEILLAYTPVHYFEMPEPYGKNDRPGDPLRPWPQLTYNGWPLYYLDNDGNPGSQADYPTMFVPATEGLPRPTAGMDAGDVGGPPGPNLGP